MPTNDNDRAYWTTKMVEEVYSILTSREQIAVEVVAARRGLTVDQLLVWALLKSGRKEKVPWVMRMAGPRKKGPIGRTQATDGVRA